MNFVALLRNTDGGTHRIQATVAGVASLRITIFPKAKYFSVLKKNPKSDKLLAPKTQRHHKSIVSLVCCLHLSEERK